MIVGGTGIASAVPYIIDHVSRASKPQTRTTRIRLIWSARQRGMYYQVFCDELAQILENPDISTTFFCTTDMSTSGRAFQGSVSEKIPKTGAVDTTKPLSTGIEFLPGRPHIRGTVMAEARAAQDSSTRLAVLACGPSPMADECRESVYEVMKGEYQDIEYYEEAFEW